MKNKNHEEGQETLEEDKDLDEEFNEEDELSERKRTDDSDDEDFF